MKNGQFPYNNVGTESVQFLHSMSARMKQELFRYHGQPGLTFFCFHLELVKLGESSLLFFRMVPTIVVLLE